MALSLLFNRPCGGTNQGGTTGESKTASEDFCSTILANRPREEADISYSCTEAAFSRPRLFRALQPFPPPPAFFRPPGFSAEFNLFCGLQPCPQAPAFIFANVRLKMLPNMVSLLRILVKTIFE
jgi:hypothetical protein